MVTFTFIGGATATGKTARAVELAKKTGAHILNFDSRQMYKYTDVVTGKDKGNAPFTLAYTQNELEVGYYTLQGSPLWLYDIAEPHVALSSYVYKTLALHLMQKLMKEGIHHFIFVGASYFYLRHVLYGFGTEQEEVDWELREELAQKSVDELQEKLKKLNIDVYLSLNNSDKFNKRRLIRRIEILHKKDTIPQNSFLPSIHAYLNIDKSLCNYQFVCLAHRSKEATVERVQKRVDERFLEGVEETNRLINRGYTGAEPGLRFSGYPILIELIQGNIRSEEAKTLWVKKELKEAKKQTTAFKGDPNFSAYIELV